MGSKDKGKKELKKPKKITKPAVTTVVKEAPTPVVVDVVKRKRKERDPDEDS